MVILDTNIFIYLANGTLNRETVTAVDFGHVSITEIEALGYSLIAVNE